MTDCQTPEENAADLAREEATHAVCIVQVFRVEREIVVFVKASSMENAVELVDLGEYETPSFDHDDWSESWELENQEAFPGDAHG